MLPMSAAEGPSSHAPATPPRVRRIGIGGVDRSQLLARLASARVQLNDFARTLFADERFTTSATATTVEVVTLSVAELGFGDGATIDRIVERAASRGLGLCPMELGPHFRLQYLDQPEGSLGFPATQHRAPPGSITVASAPLCDDDDVPKGFYLRRIDGVLWLRGYRSWPGHVSRPDDVFAFVLRGDPPSVHAASR